MTLLCVCVCVGLMLTEFVFVCFRLCKGDGSVSVSVASLRVAAERWPAFMRHARPRHLPTALLPLSWRQTAAEEQLKKTHYTTHTNQIHVHIFSTRVCTFVVCCKLSTRVHRSRPLILKPPPERDAAGSFAWQLSLSLAHSVKAWVFFFPLSSGQDDGHTLAVSTCHSPSALCFLFLFCFYKLKVCVMMHRGPVCWDPKVSRLQTAGASKARFSVPDSQVQYYHKSPSKEGWNRTLSSTQLFRDIAVCSDLTFLPKAACV